MENSSFSGLSPLRQVVLVPGEDPSSSGGVAGHSGVTGLGQLIQVLDLVRSKFQSPFETVTLLEKKNPEAILSEVAGVILAGTQAIAPWLSALSSPKAALGLFLETSAAGFSKLVWPIADAALINSGVGLSHETWVETRVLQKNSVELAARSIDDFAREHSSASIYWISSGDVFREPNPVRVSQQCLKVPLKFKLIEALRSEPQTSLPNYYLSTEELSRPLIGLLGITTWAAFSERGPWVLKVGSGLSVLSAAYLMFERLGLLKEAAFIEKTLIEAQAQTTGVNELQFDRVLDILKSEA